MSRAGGCPEQARGRVLLPSLQGRVLLTQLTKHDLLEKGQEEGCGTAGLAAGVTSIAVAKEDVARMWLGCGAAGNSAGSRLQPSRALRRALHLPALPAHGVVA